MKTEQKKVEKQLLTALNDFMKRYDIAEISFCSHSIKKTNNKIAKTKKK